MFSPGVVVAGLAASLAPWLANRRDKVNHGVSGIDHLSSLRAKRSNPGRRGTAPDWLAFGQVRFRR